MINFESAGSTGITTYAYVFPPNGTYITKRISDIITRYFRDNLHNNNTIIVTQDPSNDLETFVRRIRKQRLEGGRIALFKISPCEDDDYIMHKITSGDDGLYEPSMTLFDDVLQDNKPYPSTDKIVSTMDVILQHLMQNILLQKKLGKDK